MAAHDLPDEELERTVRVYEAHGCKQAPAAKALGIARTTLQNRLQIAEMRKAKKPPPERFAKTAVKADTDALREVLKAGPKSLDELANHFSITRGRALDLCDELGHEGVNIGHADGRVSIQTTQAPSFVHGPAIKYESRDDNTFVFGATGDSHLGSKYERLDVLNDLYDRFAARGVDRVFHTGNWIDGFRARLNDQDVHVANIEGQLEYLAENYPQRKGITTYAVTGDDHEGWWAQDGVDIGKRAVHTMQDHGRKDWVDLGYMEAHVELVNKNTGKSSILAVVHPGGGSAYADSYSVQKIIESLDGGEKPAVALYGHYHKLMFGEYRNVWWIQTGCTQDQTPFARKKKLRYSVGGAIAVLEQDPETGAIIGCEVKLMRYFVKGYYNNRWSKWGSVQLAERAP